MLIERLDRTAWKLEQAREHIARQVLVSLLADPSPATERSIQTPPWQHRPSPQEQAGEHARQELLIALRDGDLHATGRLSTRRLERWSTRHLGWDLHSGHHSSIAPEQWRGGEMNWSVAALTMSDGQFIDIRVPRFVVLAIWPERQDAARTTEYRIPYLDLLDRVIAEWRITEQNQPKQESLLDWFRDQTIEGEPISENLASAMATLVRLPASQRGGARRAGGW